MTKLIEYIDDEFEKALLLFDFRRTSWLGNRVKLSESEKLKLMALFKSGFLSCQKYELSRGSQ